jgi:hypothetical protein
MSEQRRLYGLMGEFDSAERLLHATRSAHSAGYRRMDAFSPLHIHGLARALGMHGTRLPWLVLLGGIAGALGGYAVQWYGNAWDYPYNAGGRPLHSWPAFVPVTFELSVLCAALAAVLGMLARNGLPKPYHPVFNAPRFARASRDRFFLCIESSDERFDADGVRRLLMSLHATDVVEVRE